MSKKSLLRTHSGATVLSVGIHVALLSLFLVGVRFASDPLYSISTEEVAIQATVVDENLIEREMARLEEQEQAEILRRQEEERQAREQAEAAQRELEEQQRQLELARQEQEQREQEAQLEQQRLTELQQQREAEERRLEEERLAREAEERRLEEERLAREAEERRLEEERLAREEEERRLREEQLAREAEEARQRAEMEAELRRVMAAEEERRAAEEAGLLDQYRLLIQARIEQNWNRPGSAGPGLECEVSVTQIPSGDVINVSIGRCNGDDAVVRSIEQAVLRASPLPPPPTPSLFSRNLELIFRPDA